MKTRLTKYFWAKAGLLIGALAIILLIMPRTDHQSYTFELNQPWKYPLLTAEYDTPVLRDSASVKQKRDSINSNFIPFVKESPQVAEMNLERLSNALADSISAADALLLRSLLERVYAQGIIDAPIVNSMSKMSEQRVREANPDDATKVKTRDVAGMRTAGEAYSYIDSAYNESKGMSKGMMPAYVGKALHSSIAPNIILDTINDSRFRSQELMQVTAATGVIKEGQRIVDRGDIVTPQIYTNLKTYMGILEKAEQKQGYTEIYYALGKGIVIFLLLLFFFLYLRTYRRSIYDSVRKVCFLTVYITVFVIFAILMFEWVPNGLNLVPFAAVPVVVMIFFDSRTSIMSLLTTVLISSLVATFPQQFIIMEMLAGVVATMSINQLSRRSQLLQTALLTFVVYCISYFGLQLLRDGAFDVIDYKMFGYFAVNAVILSFAYVMIFLVEKIFGFTSNVTLVELSDINNKLLRRLASEAPGTFQHSVQVSTLAAEAARAVGANTQLVRTGALYHDIGKLENPVNFTENQHGINPLLDMTPEESAGVIISHIKNGINLANKHNLPKPIRDFILEHHGKGVARYFYTTAVNQRGAENVDKSKFQYPGPNPLSKETAILMMADAVEAASRSLKDYSPQSISGLVNKIIDGQVAEGMFNDSPISFQDISKIKQSFIERLATIYHTRIAYPEMNKPEGSGTSGAE